jgi:hypothetical protein
MCVLAATLGCTFGTTVISIVMPEGIVLSVDSKTIGSDAGAGSAVKLVLMENRLAVATAWLTRVSGYEIKDNYTGRTYAFEYNFETWIRSIEKRLPSNITVAGLSGLIERESADTFKNFGLLIKSGGLKKDEFAGDTLVRYYITGYERGIPLLYTVEIQVDWQRQELVGPKTTLIHPKQGGDVEFNFNAGGIHAAIDQILKREGEAYEKALARAPNELNKLLAKHDLTLDEAVRLSTALIQIEAEASPGKVGLPVRVVTIPKVGAGNLTIHN